jgi:hypothetical protein
MNYYGIMINMILREINYIKLLKAIMIVVKIVINQ